MATITPNAILATPIAISAFTPVSDATNTPKITSLQNTVRKGLAIFPIAPHATKAGTNTTLN
jgi:hypothetical protein